MMIKLTVRNIMNLGLWGRLCEYKGWDKQIVQNGLISPDTEVEFDDEFLKKDVVPIEDLKIFLFNISSEQAIYCGTLLAKNLEDAKIRLGTIHNINKVTTIQEITKEQLYNMKNKHLVLSRIPL
ncbi:MULTISPECIES: hypothetical protein [Clostridium]|nr:MULTISPECIES: hypothetical protein [Clostridium]MBU5226063.1 hypothetical protein [Clostridium senegalense]